MKRASVLTALLALACGNPTPPPQPNAFDRPEDVAFFCWNLTTSSPTALADCAPPAPPSIDEDDGEPREGYALHAIVTQTTTGEVAAVRLTGSDDEPGVIDTDVRIPGYTFAAVGEVPSALAVSRLDPRHVFVLSRGSGDVHVIETAQFRGGLGAASTAFDVLGERALPSAMRLAPDERSLFVALPEAGQLARLPITGGDLGAAELLDLASALPAPVDLSAQPPAARWLYTCGTPPLSEPPATPPREPVSLGATPTPAAIIEDPETGALLVADRALPLIHVVDPVALVETATVNVSVPVEALALTPRVPATIDATSPTVRYLYAVDATDGSVLAIDWTDPASPSFGGVLSVEVQPPHDRLEVPFPARALAVVSPSYDAAEPITACTDAQDGAYASGINLHGVFLAVATVDGRVRIHDVYDEDTACRGFDCGEGRDIDVEDQIVAIARHRPRFGSYMESGVVLDPEPTWDTDGVGVEIVQADGGTNSPDLVPQLTPVTCAAPLDAIYPLDGASPLVCAIRDPWAAISQTFSVLYEGQIPFTATTGGNFETAGDATFLLSHTDYCAVGVLGVEDRPGAGELAAYDGDVVAITGDLPPSILRGTDDALLSRCSQLTERTTGGEITPVLIQILEAESHPEGVHETYVGRLRLGDVIRPAGATLAEVLACYPELLEFEVRTQNAFTVIGGRNGFQHPVVEGADHGCEVDPAREAAGRRGRAFFDSVFSTPELTFALGARPSGITERHPELSIAITDVPTGLNVDVSTVGGTSGPSLLTRLVYNDVDERLYAVDQSAQGLLRIQLTRLSVQQTFR